MTPEWTNIQTPKAQSSSAGLTKIQEREHRHTPKDRHTASHFRETKVPTTLRTDTNCPSTEDPILSEGQTHLLHCCPLPLGRTGRQAGPAPPAESGCPGLAGGAWVEASWHPSSYGVGRRVSHPAGLSEATLDPAPAAVGAQGSSQSAAATQTTV